MIDISTTTHIKFRIFRERNKKLNIKNKRTATRSHNISHIWLHHDMRDAEKKNTGTAHKYTAKWIGGSAWI